MYQNMYLLLHNFYVKNISICITLWLFATIITCVEYSLFSVLQLYALFLKKKYFVNNGELFTLPSKANSLPNEYQHWELLVWNLHNHIYSMTQINRLSHCVIIINYTDVLLSASSQHKMLLWLHVSSVLSITSFLCNYCIK